MKPSAGEWFMAGAKTSAGAAALWLACRAMVDVNALLVGWVAMIGLIFLRHFGIFHLLALGWRAAGVGVVPLMRAPMMASSLSKLWGRRWNLAVPDILSGLVVKPLVCKGRRRPAILLAFLLSGLVHDLVISVPAGTGYGLPTVYFLLQGFANLLERSWLGRSLGLRAGLRGRLFMFVTFAGPAF